MTLYHGSTIDIPCIDLSLSKPNKDFGRSLLPFRRPSTGTGDGTVPRRIRGDRACGQRL